MGLTRAERLELARYTEGLTRASVLTDCFAVLVYWEGVVGLLMICELIEIRDGANNSGWFPFPSNGKVSPKPF